MSTTAPLPAAPVTPAECVGPLPLRTAMARLHAAVSELRRRRRVARTRRVLAALDDATLRDIGMTHAEAGSMAAEVHDAAIRTRVRALGRSVAEGWA